MSCNKDFFLKISGHSIIKSIILLLLNHWVPSSQFWMFFEGFPFFPSKHSTNIGSWSIQWATIAHYSELNHKTGRTWQFSYPSRLGHNFSLLFWTKWEARDGRKYPTLSPHWWESYNGNVNSISILYFKGYRDSKTQYSET